MRKSRDMALSFLIPSSQPFLSDIDEGTITGCSATTTTTKPLTKSTSCCGSRSCGLYKIRPQRKGRQTCRFFLCDLKIMNLLQNQRGRCIDSGSQLLIEHIQTLGVSAE